MLFFFFQAEDGIRDLVRSRGLGDVYKRQELERLKKAIADNDIESIKRFMEDVRQASYKMSEELYKQAQASGAAGASGAGQQPGAEDGPNAGRAGEHSADDDVIDADFRPMDDK